MPDPNNDNHHSSSIHAINDPIIAYANPKMVSLRFELLASWRKRIFAERSNLLGDAPLKSPFEVPKLPRGRRREFKNVAHGR